MKKQAKKMLVYAAAAILVLCGVMSATKPSEERYKSWVLDKVSERASGANPLMGLGLSLFGERMINEGTVVSDYGIVRVFETEFKGKRIKVLGGLGMFVPLGKPADLIEQGSDKGSTG
ncbi:hypothetical protein MKZ24_09980 [Paenibacillus sp. FSL R7-0297]|uniref:hypothetical protein n=1 Tax=unclassified Paenibacillus TaxID=185978 RepID=UPI0005AA37CC|nr:hypothetical protein [Paenibacillus sp. FSL R5-0912]